MSEQSQSLEWQYSRNQLRHWVADGDYYGEDFMYLWEIRELRDDCKTQKYGNRGYDLYHRGVKVAHAKSVKLLKEEAAAMASGK